MAHKIPKDGRMIRRTRSGGSVAIEFDDEHGERVIGEYMWVGWSAERARAEEVLRWPPIAICGRHPKDPRWRQ